MVSEKTTAKNEIVDSVRDLLNLKLTVPLGNPNLKRVHTNQFLWTELPDEFILENFSLIASKLKSSYSRFTGYTVNRWYIEGVTINNDGDKFTMELDLNPFATTLNQYKDERDSFEKTYSDAVNKSTSTTTKTTNTAKSTGNTTLKGGAGKVLDKVVKNAVGKETNALKKAKLIDKAFKSHVYYNYYYNCKFSSIEKAWNNKHLNCADGANVLCAMFRSGGLEAKIVHVTKHYIVRLKINGKYYYTDNAASTGSHTTRAFGKTWKGMTKGSVVGTKIPM